MDTVERHATQTAECRAAGGPVSSSGRSNISTQTVTHQHDHIKILFYFSSWFPAQSETREGGFCAQHGRGSVPGCGGKSCNTTAAKILGAEGEDQWDRSAAGCFEETS